MVEHSDTANPEDWEEIHGFRSPGEFHRFQKWIVDAIEDGSLVEIEVGERYGGTDMLEERWFKAPSGQRWRLLSPEAPFRGAFERIPPI